MLLTILSLVLTIVGVTLIIVECKTDCGTWVFILGVLLTVISFVLFSLFGFMSILTACNKDIDYEKAVYEREVLEYRIDNQEKNLVGNEKLYKDIVEFNNNLRSVKKWSKNIWTSWLYNEKIAELDYIEFDVNLVATRCVSTKHLRDFA